MSHILHKHAQGRMKMLLAGRYYIILNLLCFNLLWLSLVLFRYQGLVPAMLLLLLMFAFCPEKYRALRLSALLAGIGIAVDAALSYAGIFIFADSLMPLWLMLLWFGFAFALPYAFGFLLAWSVPLQSLMGVIASLNYTAGLVLGAVDYGWPLLQTQLLLALIWAVLLPLFCYLLNYRNHADEEN